MKIHLPVSWEVCGMVEIEADSICEAMDIFNATHDDIPLPDDYSYVDGSFDLTVNEPEWIQVYNEGSLSIPMNDVQQNNDCFVCRNENGQIIRVEIEFIQEDDDE